MMRVLRCFRLAGLLLLALGAGAGPSPADPPGAGLRVSDAWIRWLPAGLPGAGYMTLTNTGPEERVVLGASSPDYAEVGMHLSQAGNGMMQMSPVKSVAVKPGATVRFAEGGYHLMLMHPKRDLHPGDTVVVTLELDGGRSLAVPFGVRGPR